MRKLLQGTSSVSSYFYPYIELEYQKDNLLGKCMKHTHE